MSERPIDIWRKRLEYFQAEEAKASDAAQKFTLQEQIEEAKQKIAEFERETASAVVSQTGKDSFERRTETPEGRHAPWINAEPNPEKEPPTGASLDRFNWLHLTDLHCGQTGERHLWPEIRHHFFEDLDKLHDKCGPWQAVLFSGDFVQKGALGEFGWLEQDVLGPLWNRFTELHDIPPVLLAVPGNHDLQRPGNDIEKSLQPALKWLLSPDLFPQIADEFFEDPESSYRKIVDTTLANYVKWADEQRHRQDHSIRTSRFPGDFSTTFQLPGGRRVGVVGLNAAFLQLAADNYQGKLAWDVRQFHAVCEGDGPAWTTQHDICLLMTHQGPEWLNEPSRTRDLCRDQPSWPLCRPSLRSRARRENAGADSWRRPAPTSLARHVALRPGTLWRPSERRPSPRLLGRFANVPARSGHIAALATQGGARRCQRLAVRGGQRSLRA